MNTSLRIILTAAVISLPAANVFPQPTDQAVNYLEYFNEMYKPIQKEMWEYTSAVAKGKKARIIDSRRKDLVTQLRMAEKRAVKASDYKGDGALRDVVAGWMNASQIILVEDFEKIMNLEEIAEESYDAMEAYLKAKEMASEHMDEKSRALTEEVDRFARTNHITLIDEESKLSKKLGRANKVFKYHNEIYLLFFKCYKQEIYLIDALSKGDINGMEQNKGTLLKFVDECSGKLNDIQNINADVSIKTACREVFDFYRQEASGDINELSDFYFEKEKFERIQKAFESKSQSQRTRADVDKYNQAVAEFNKRTAEFNAKNNELNRKRNQAIDNWNKSVDRYFSKHAT